MSIKQKIEFNELDIKFHEELPTVMDLLSACTNKIIDLLTPIHDNLDHFLNEMISKKENYKLKIIFKNMISFNNEIFSSNKATTLNKIHNQLAIINRFHILHIESKDCIEVEFGLYYDPNDETYDNTEPFYHFTISYNPNKLEINLKDESFYKKIETDLKEKYFIKSEYVGKDNIDSEKIHEWFEIIIQKYEPELINQASKDFMEKVLAPILMVLP